MVTSVTSLTSNHHTCYHYGRYQHELKSLEQQSEFWQHQCQDLFDENDDFGGLAEDILIHNKTILDSVFVYSNYKPLL